MSIERVRDFVRAVEQGATGAELAAFFTPDARVEELPNRLFPRGVTRALTQILESAEQGRKVMAWQRYEVRSAVQTGDTVALELAWSGALAVDRGPLKAGHELRARIAMFVELRDGRIAAARNYDCYEPF